MQFSTTNKKIPIARERTGVSYSSVRLNLVLSDSSSLYYHESNKIQYFFDNSTRIIIDARLSLAVGGTMYGTLQRVYPFGDFNITRKANNGNNLWFSRYIIWLFLRDALIHAKRAISHRFTLA